MNSIEDIFQEFVDAIQTANDPDACERVATRLTERLGFQRFAYLRLTSDTPMLISSYPNSWTSRYFRLGYQQLDPVVRRARLEHALFSWGGEGAAPIGNREQRRFFDEARSFGIRSGITVPIRAGFGGMAAFTLATGDREVHPERLVAQSKDVVQLVALYFHTHVAVRLDLPATGQQQVGSDLTQRERQCLAWTAQGKTVADIAVLIGVSPRTVAFHLENARRKLGAASIAQCVAEAMRRGLLS
ncbi:LuxR family transcriptional regulator [Bradyrhizobium sp. BRP22]|uniref:autoinducer binding domain-containing protein n=1 Tax=Bradyrhizobium sp. BRP22 TaxID=2793821 RepID=UPI001CD5A1CD|nr:autoinducer binding domain-containing protein [Bradyrhizobium sp. BRP22]MCA1457058.1 LuxR family transcriptional regulator [Bradyrhizobium sp. BRP22]